MEKVRDKWGSERRSCVGTHPRGSWDLFLPWVLQRLLGGELSEALPVVGCELSVLSDNGAKTCYDQ